MTTRAGCSSVKSCTLPTRQSGRAGPRQWSLRCLTPTRGGEAILITSCQKGHGSGSEHVARFSSGVPPPGGAEAAIVNPAKLSREGQMDLSSLCHAGVGQALAPPLSFVAGDALEKFLKLASPSSGEHVDFHGSQTQTLMKSRVGRAVGRRICWRPGVRGCARNAGRRLAGRPRPFAAGCGIAGARVPTTPARLTGPRC